MHKAFLQFTAIFGGLAVALGAFGAHALKKHLNESALGIFETAIRYQFYHVFALALTAILFKDFGGKYLSWSGNMFIAGIVLFSGSLYLLTYIKGTGKQGLDWVGIVTPFGGLAFILGWLFLFLGLYKATVTT